MTDHQTNPHNDSPGPAAYRRGDDTIWAMPVTDNPRDNEHIERWCFHTTPPDSLIRVTIPVGGHGLIVHTPDGTVTAHPGDYVIQDTDGYFYPVPSDTFHSACRPLKPAVTKHTWALPPEPTDPDTRLTCISEDGDTKGPFTLQPDGHWEPSDDPDARCTWPVLIAAAAMSGTTITWETTA